MKKYVSDSNLGKVIAKLKSIFAKKTELPTNKSAASGGTDYSLVTTGDKYNWNNNYLPKSGGTMTGDVKLSGGSMIVGRNDQAMLKDASNGDTFVGNAGKKTFLVSTSGTNITHRKNATDYDMLDSDNTAANPTLAGTETNLTGLKVNGTSYKVPQGMENPMTTEGDLIVGGTSGTAQRLPIGSAKNFLRTNAGSVSWGAIHNEDIYNNNFSLGKVLYSSSNSEGFNVVWGKPASDFGLGYLTTAPSADNTNGLKIVVLSAEPAQRYNGYLYIILGA